MRSISDTEYQAIVDAGFVTLLHPEQESSLYPARAANDHRWLWAADSAQDERPRIPLVGERWFRDRAFTARVREVYENRCAFTGLRILNGGGRPEVQAAHIQPVARQGPDTLRNGLVSGTVHWMSDRGLISLDDEGRLLLAAGSVPEEVQRLLPQDRRARLPEDPGLRPHPQFLRFHRTHVFKGLAREQLLSASGPSQHSLAASSMSPLHVSTSSPLWDGLEPLLRRAREVDIAVAYATTQGVRLLLAALEHPLQEGAFVRVLVGCYLGGTRPEALHELLRLDQRGARVSFIADPNLHFHPKVYRILDGDGLEHLFVGSSNLSRSALRGGPYVHEWTLGLERAQAGSLLDEARDHLERLFADLGQRLTPEVIVAFEQTQLAQPTLPPAALLDPEESPDEAVLEPNEAQRHALEALAQARRQGHRRALVVAATGLGKTLLAAFDTLAVVPMKGRVLVVAHRRGLLDQAAVAMRRVRDKNESQGFVDQTDDQRDCTQAFVSVASLGRLSDAELRSFAYVVVDEAHHGTAASYRRLFDVAEPRFLLGLTATPERLDGGDIYGLFHGVVACEVHLLEGIRRGWLVPFSYRGVLDPIDYSTLTWTGGKLGYAPEQLDALLLSDERTGVLLEQMGDPAQNTHRTLVFCVSIAHARHTTDVLTAAGWRVAQVHSGAGASPPGPAIDALRRRPPEIGVIVTVDMFNEGVDIPEVDRIVMLRPTDSPTIFLQQLGRGLRRCPPKERLLVIDLVGNHRRAVQKLTWLGVSRDEVQGAPAGQRLQVKIPGGSEVILEPQALDAIQAVSRALGGPRARLLDAVARLFAQQDRRPRLSELLAESGLALSTMRTLFGSWLDLLATAGVLEPGCSRTGRACA